MYRYGEFVSEEAAQAVKWFRKAAEKADVRAQYNLGEMYLYGEGVPQDYVQAHKWFNLATARKSGECSPKVIQRAKNESEQVMTSSPVK